MNQIQPEVVIHQDQDNLDRLTPAPAEDASDTERIIRLVELLFFAYRDFVSDPDAILTDFGFGRAHHRVLHFVGRNPGMRVSELLDILQITKQSLGRVLRELIEKGYVYQEEGKEDRRQRLLHLTESGNRLRLDLLEPQLKRIRAACSGVEDRGVGGETLLLSLINSENRDHVLRLLRSN